LDWDYRHGAGLLAGVETMVAWTDAEGLPDALILVWFGTIAGGCGGHQHGGLLLGCEDGALALGDAGGRSDRRAGDSADAGRSGMDDHRGKGHLPL